MRCYNVIKLFHILGRFRKYDFGPEENNRIYGSFEPPEYNFTNIKAKLHILYGTHDDLIRSEVHFDTYLSVLFSVVNHCFVSEYGDISEKSQTCCRWSEPIQLIQPHGFRVWASS